MSKKKTIAVAIVLALILLIGGMLAYFTDTDTETNEFTLGKVNIEIDETWDSTNGENVIPGQTITKAPSITNQNDSTAAYVFAEIVVPCYVGANDALTPLFTFTANSGWTLINTPAADATSKTITYVYAYGSASEMTRLAVGSITSTAVFNEVTVAPTLTNTQAGSVATTDIVVNAYGIQADNLTETAPSAIFTLAQQQ